MRTDDQRRIYLIRHGESEANVDAAIYEDVPDYRVALTAVGIDQACRAGADLRHRIGAGSVRVYVSPYLRAYQTLDALDLGGRLEQVIEEPRLREQDWANFQDAEDIATQKAERDDYGHFFYRFREGESGADVYDRVAGFIEALKLSFAEVTTPRDVLLVTHGLTMRLFCMRWFGWTVEYFESLDNPGNAEVKCLIGQGSDWRLDRAFAQWKLAAADTTIADRIRRGTPGS